MQRILLINLLLLIFLTGCSAGQAREPIACPAIIEPKLLSFPWDTMTMSDLDNWVKTSFPTAIIRDRQTDHEFIQIGWMVSDESYGIYYKGRVRLIDQNLPSELTIADLLHCYGDPTYYAMEYTQAPEAAAIRLQFWYPELGLRFTSEDYSGWRPKTKFDRQARVHSVTISPGGTIEQVLKSGTAHDEIVVEILSRIQPWPQDFDVIEYQGDFKPN